MYKEVNSPLTNSIPHGVSSNHGNFYYYSDSPCLAVLLVRGGGWNLGLFSDQLIRI